MKRCPTEAELLSFVDATLLPEQLRLVEQHVDRCSSCAKHVHAFTEIVHDIAAPLSASLDVEEHVGSVLHRLDRAPARRLQPRNSYWMGALLAAAAVVVFFVLPQRDLGRGVFTSRGGHAHSTLARDVGVQIYLRDTSLQPLTSARRIKASAALTAGLRNLGPGPAYVLLFAVDAQNAVHWIAPEFIDANSDPVAVRIPTSTSERPLPNSVVFEDLASGTLRIFALISPQPLHVSQVEALSVQDLTEAGLQKRFAGADVRQTVVEVSRE